MICIDCPHKCGEYINAIISDNNYWNYQLKLKECNVLIIKGDKTNDTNIHQHDN